jgi:hypothetical protein
MTAASSNSSIRIIPRPRWRVGDLVALHITATKRAMEKPSILQPPYSHLLIYLSVGAAVNLYP